jgi:AraC-like DNA-binding protein
MRRRSRVGLSTDAALDDVRNSPAPTACLELLRSHRRAHHKTLDVHQRASTNNPPTTNSVPKIVQALHGDDLADRAHMSPSTFRSISAPSLGVSPSQYKKRLRLQEARQLMLNENLDAVSAGGRVGYESPSQFSREYSRLFGAPPQRDVTRIRLVPVATASARRTARGPERAAPVHATARRDRCPHPGELAVARTCEKLRRRLLASMTLLGRPRTTLALKCVKACNCSARTWRSYTIPATMRSLTSVNR